MSKILAYLRVSTNKQDLNNQRLEILDYAHKQRIEIHDFIELTISSQKTQKERRIEELFSRLEPGDTLLVTELSRLGRSTGQVISLIDQLLAAQIQVHILKQNLRLDLAQTDLQSRAMITLFSLFAEMERMLISQRTKEALASKKAQGITLGKPQGTLQNSIYDKDRQRIVELLNLGLSIRQISRRHLGYGSISSLNYYIRTRKLHLSIP